MRKTTNDDSLVQMNMFTIVLSVNIFRYSPHRGVMNISRATVTTMATMATVAARAVVTTRTVVAPRMVVAARMVNIGLEEEWKYG